LWLDRFGLAQYVWPHGVGFPFIRCLGRESHNRWLGTVHAVQPAFTPESRHRFRFHRQPCWLGGSEYHERFTKPNNTPTMKQKISHWIPMGFCACLALISLPTQIFFSSGSSGAWVIPFLCFLPMCFFFVAAVTSNLQREVRDLREQVAKLQGKRVGSQDAA